MAGVESLRRFILHGIKSGELPHGERLPKRAFLCETFGLGPNSVSDTLQALTQLGHLEKKGKFYFPHFKLKQMNRGEIMAIILESRLSFSAFYNRESTRVFADTFANEAAAHHVTIQQICFSTESGPDKRYIYGYKSFLKFLKEAHNRLCGVIVACSEEKLPKIEHWIVAIRNSKKPTVWYDWQNPAKIKKNKSYSLAYPSSLTKSFFLPKAETSSLACMKLIQNKAQEFKHEKVGFLQGLRASGFEGQREKLYWQAFHKVFSNSINAGLCHSEPLSFRETDDYKVPWHREIEIRYLKFLKQHPSVTLLVTPNDRVASQLYRISLSRGPKIPTELSVISIGNNPEYKIWPLATIDLNWSQLAYQVFHYLRQDLKVNPIRRNRILVKPNLVNRGLLEHA